ncbi:MAG: glycosyltransferase family 9 protein [Candidatus Omnitrophica bacterium]|nr:glycosyltransferase family 9 protein [Candidatus Omnitrophota bacterium]
MKIFLLKLLDKTLGRLIVRALPAFKIPVPADIKTNKILLIRPGGIGDAVLLIPAINDLAKSFPKAKIFILCEKRNVEIFKLLNSITGIYVFDSGLDILKVLQNNYDVVIDTEQWHNLSAFVAYTAKSPVKIGFATNNRGKLFNIKIDYSHDDYEVYSFLNLINPLTAKDHTFRKDTPFLLSEIKLPYFIKYQIKNKSKGIVSIFPGATVNERRWDINNFADVAKDLQASGYTVVLLGGAQDKSRAARIHNAAPGAIIAAARTSLEETAGIIKHSKLLITADSGLMHMAYALGTPTISLFGAGIEKKWAPIGAGHVVINKNLPCSPCTKFGYTPWCRKKVECLSAISAGEVLEAAATILARS